MMRFWLSYGILLFLSESYLIRSGADAFLLQALPTPRLLPITAATTLYSSTLITTKEDDDKPDTTVPRYHLAELNIGKMLKDLDDPVMDEFRINLEQINALAEESPGFVWRYQSSETGDATDTLLYEDTRIILNLSVWEDVDSLMKYVYLSNHGDFYRRRKQWFIPMESNHIVLWWVPVGTEPTPLQAKAKLDQLDQMGPTVDAFSFGTRFTAEEFALAQTNNNKEATAIPEIIE